MSIRAATMIPASLSTCVNISCIKVCTYMVHLGYRQFRLLDLTAVSDWLCREVYGRAGLCLLQTEECFCVRYMSNV